LRKEKDSKIYVKIEKSKKRICVSLLEYFRSKDKRVYLKNKVLHLSEKAEKIHRRAGKSSSKIK